jgi:uncharacterized membrane protein
MIEQNDIHGKKSLKNSNYSTSHPKNRQDRLYFIKSATNGKMAKWRERFTADATRRWYFRLLPVIRRGSNLPCSLMN